MTEEAKEEMEPLHVQSEVRAFGDFDVELKALSGELYEKTRIIVLKNLSEAPGGSTLDFEPLEIIFKGISDEKKKALKEGLLKKAVVVFSDGESSKAEKVKNVLKKLRELGIVVVGVGITESAEAIRQTYKPKARISKNPSDLPETLSELLEELTRDL